ncbi:MAG TPA: prolipoprotein diacylglyceryl transferase [Pseudobdellovibrionaceae bacterium]|nr:prolipoprotein diacylglyceryl transferase [Pseudobdellovibrionaceae bacterium]
MLPWIRIGEVSLPSFLLVQSLNAVLLLAWARSRALRLNLSPRVALDLVLTVLVSGLIGGRLLHVLWETPGFYLENPTAVFHLMNGGYVYFGGLIAGLLAGFFFLKLRGEAFQTGSWFDFAAPLASLGTALGRIGCFLAGCCYGKVCFLRWAFPFQDDKGLSLLRHPTQLYSVLWELGVLAILLGLEKIPAKNRPSFLRPAGALFLTWVVLHGIGRFLIEFVRDDFRGPVFYLSISQWLSVCALVLSCLVLRRISAHPRGIPTKLSK